MLSALFAFVPTGSFAQSLEDHVAVAAYPDWVAPVAVPQEAFEEAAKLDVAYRLFETQRRLTADQHDFFRRASIGLNTPAGVEGQSTFAVRFDPAYEEVLLHELVIIRDGSRIDKLDVSAFDLYRVETDRDRLIYNGDLEISYVIPDVRQGDVADPDAWPAAAEVVVALHACGPAFDAVVNQAMAASVPWVLAVPCCYSSAIEFSDTARAWADHLGVAAQAHVRRRFVESLIDTERTLRLEAGGYRVSVQAFVPPAVTPHNLLWRAQRVGPSRRSAEAEERRRRLVSGPQ